MERIIVEGHRGYCSEYPENTMISFEAALDLGVDAFEFDVWLTSDKVPMLMHDGNALRTCGVDKHLRDMTYAEALELEPAYTKKFGDKYVGKGIKVPTLDGMVDLDIPEGTQTGSQFRMRGKGVPYMRGNTRGNQYVTVNVEVPKNLSNKQKEILREFEDEKNYKQKRTFTDKIKDLFN